MLFLPKRLVAYFGENGLSMSEANHQANMTKEIAEAIGRKIDGIRSVSETMSHDNGKEVPLDKNTAIDPTELLNIAQEEGKLYALSAWLREGVKAKQVLLDLIRKASNGSFMSDTETFPAIDAEQPIFIQPVKPAYVTEDDIFGTFTVKERAEYLTLEATAAHLGKKIHAGGIISKIRKETQEFVPVRFSALNSGTGPKDYPVQRTLLYDPTEFDKVFFALQAKHREAEQKLNGYKARIQNEITLQNAEIEKDYSVVYNEARLIFDKEAQEYNSKHQSVQKEQQVFLGVLEARRLEKVKEVSGWKIVIPHELEDTLEFVKNFSK